MQQRAAPQSITGACVVLLKWDALELGKQQGFDIVKATVDWLEAEQLHMLLIIRIKKLSAGQIDTLYQNVRDEWFFDSMRASLIDKPAVALLVGGQDDVINRVKALKGDPDTPGTMRWRWSYKREFERTPDYAGWLAKKGVFADKDAWQEIQYKIYRDDKIHCSDSAQDTINNCRTLFSPEEIRALLARYPKLAHVVSV